MLHRCLFFVKFFVKMALKYTTAYLLFSVLILYSHQRALDPKEHLQTYGFMNASDSPQDMEKAIKKFQAAHNLTVTGVLNSATMDKMNAPRCGRPSNVFLFAAAQNKWRKSQLTYKIVNWTEPFTKRHIKDTFDKAIMQWTNGVNLRITETTSQRADIEIYFTAQDGGGNVLGYAFYPEHGDIFFDRDERWTLLPVPAPSKIGFVWVATHELGHALGIPHTETMDSIMFPYYTSYVTKPSSSDISRLKRLYGEQTLDNSVLCDGASVDAILDTTTTSLLIKGRQYWTMSNDLLQNGPYFLDMVFPGLPDEVDAAFTIKKTIYFLANNVFFKYSYNSTTSSQKRISNGFEGVPGNIDAAFFDTKGSNIYFFKGSKYYVFNIRKPAYKRLVVNGKSIKSDWSGVPEDIEAATLLKNSRVLFIKRSKCYVVSLDSKQVISTESCSTFYQC